MAEHPPKVMISYTHDSAEHKRRILELSERLRAEGVDSHIDQYETSPPEGWSRWMVNRVRESDFVIVACTENYYRRFTGQETPGRGLGAQWEGSLITQDLYERSARNVKFIPVIFSEADAEWVPEVLRGATHYRPDLEEGYEDLYRRLTAQPRVKKSPLGSRRILEPADPAGAKGPPHTSDAAPPATTERSTGSAPGPPGKDELVLIFLNEKRFAFVPAARVELGEDLELELTPEDPRTAAFLSDLKSSQFLPEMAVAFRNTAVQGSLNRITSVHERGGGEHWKAIIRPSKESFYSPMGDFVFNGYGPDELAELRARRILLNERITRPPGRWGMEDQLVESMIARSEGLIGRVVAPAPLLYPTLGAGHPYFMEAVRLMCVLYLKLTATVEHIFALDLELTADGSGIEVRFEGQRPARYKDAPQQIIKVEGLCPFEQ